MSITYFIHWKSLSIWKMTEEDGGTNGEWTWFPSTTCKCVFRLLPRFLVNKLIP